MRNSGRKQKGEKLLKPSSLVDLLPLDGFAGTAADEMGSCAAEMTGNLIDTIVLVNSDIGGIINGRGQKTGGDSSCDLELEDAVEGMVGGNFNTFGEHTPDVYYNNEGRDSQLIERLANQIQQELHVG